MGKFIGEHVKFFIKISFCVRRPEKAHHHVRNPQKKNCARAPLSCTSPKMRSSFAFDKLSPLTSQIGHEGDNGCQEGVRCKDAYRGSDYAIGAAEVAPRCL